MRKVEEAYLLANAQPTMAPNSQLYNSTRGTIEFQEINVSFNCFPIIGDQINKYASMMLQNDLNVGNGDPRKIVLDFNDYEWAVMRGGYKPDGSGDVRGDGIVENTGIVKDILSNTNLANTVAERYNQNVPLGGLVNDNR